MKFFLKKKRLQVLLKKLIGFYPDQLNIRLTLFYINIKRYVFKKIKAIKSNINF